jgi:DNA-binding CsgD family transcriptional regulator
VELTQRQQELVMHLANGLRYEEIADEMNLSLGSVKTTVATARRRAGANTVPHLVSIAIAHGILVWNADDQQRAMKNDGAGPEADPAAGSS